VRIVCPGCKRVLTDVPSDYPPRPFCSARCKFLDLDNWLSERYTLSEPLPPSSSPDAQGDEDENFN
jgi:uncharacterized protein